MYMLRKRYQALGASCVSGVASWAYIGHRVLHKVAARRSVCDRLVMVLKESLTLPE